MTRTRVVVRFILPVVTAAIAVAALGAASPGSQSPQGTITGQVSDAVTGDPIGGALVSFSPGGLAALTSSDGTYQATVPVGTYSLTAQAQNHPSQSVFGVVVTNGGTTTVKFAMPLPPATGILTGHVRDATSNAPIANAVVSSSPNLRTTTTDATGLYTLSLPAGTYMVRASAASYLTASVQGVTVSNQSTTTRDLSLSFPPNMGIITGHVLDHTTRAPIPNAVVTDTTGGHATATDGAGLYALVLPVGTYTVTASATGYLDASSSEVVVSNQATTTRDFSLAVSPAVAGLHAFRGGPDGVSPNGFLVQATDGDFYGSTYAGGAWNLGTVFKMTPAGAVTLLHTFTGGSGGADPGPLIQAADGNFYGTTYYGGGSGFGTVFKMTPAGAVTLLHTFTANGQGLLPHAALLQATDGNFYGTTIAGGPTDSGTVFKMTPAGSVTLLHAFTASVDGFHPYAALVQGMDGNLYGTNLQGGPSGFGTVFKITPAGTATVLHAFTGGDDGFYPFAALVQATDGNFYGSSTQGGASGFGAVFKITPAGAVTVLHAFTGGEGAFATGALIEAADGNFYGTTGSGGGVGFGAVFKITPAGAVTVLHAFAGGAGGAYPHGALIQAIDGNLYGTSEGGASNTGTVFQITPAGAVTILYNFTAGIDGFHPWTALIQATDGDFYGTTINGGTSALGTVFKMTPAGTVTVLHAFTGGTDGASPGAALMQAADGNFYGTTYYGGGSDLGTVFKMTPAGTVTVLHAFAAASDGAEPGAALIQATDGNFYGTTYAGGSSDLGTVFKMTPAGSVTVLHAFTGGSDGAYPAAALIQGTDGNFYGTTVNGGVYDSGTVFSMTPAGDVTVLHTFTGGDHVYPQAALIQATDGNFYGTTVGDLYSFYGGTVFRMTPAGAVTVLHAFNVFTPGGANPYAGLIQATDGNLYGTTFFGGPFDSGTLFRMTPAGAVTVLHTFAGSDGDNPGAGLIEATDGNFYGTTPYGGAFNLGVAFRMTLSTTGPAPNAVVGGMTQPDTVGQNAGLRDVSNATVTPDQRSKSSDTTSTVTPALTPQLLSRIVTEMPSSNAPVKPGAPVPSPAAQSSVGKLRTQSAPSPVASRGRRWEIEAFGGGTIVGHPTQGNAALPAAGASFTTTTGQSSRRVSSWYFGDGARLLNDVNAAMAVSQQIRPLDAVLNTAVAQLQSGGGGGVRVSRVLTPRVTAELAIESSAVRVDLTGAGLASLEASRASFQSTWNGLASAGQFVNTAVTSVGTLQKDRGHPLVVTGAINVTLKKVAKATPYVTLGAGVVSTSDNTVRASLVGDYQFLLGGVTPVHETDSVTVWYAVDDRVAVGVLGSGFKYSVSSRVGLRVDWRTYLGPNRRSTILDSTSVVWRFTPAGSGASLTNPGLQFSNDPSIGIQSNLSGPKISGFRTFAGTGIQHQVSVTMGLFWRF